MLKVKKGLSILMSIALIVNVFSVVMLSGTTVADASTQRVLWLNADDTEVGAIPGISMTIVPSGGVTGNAYQLTAAGYAGIISYINKMITANSVVADKKYITRAKYKLASDWPTDTQANLLHYISGTAVNPSIAVNSTTGTHPENSDYRYYSYVKPGWETQQDEYYQAFPQNVKLDDNAVGAINQSDYTLSKDNWTTVEGLVNKSKSGQIEVSHHFVGDYINKNVLMDDAVVEELALNNIAIKYNNSDIPQVGLTTGIGNDISFSANVYNQFGTETGFKDPYGRVLEPIKWTITAPDGSLVWEGGFDLSGATPTAPIYIQTNKKTYTLATPKDGKTQWSYPTYDFVVKSTESAEIGEYTVTASLQNSDIYGSSTTKSFKLTIDGSTRNDNNLFQNSGLETGSTTPWFKDGGNLEVKGDIKSSGSYSGLMSGRFSIFCFAKQTVSIAPNKTYLVSGQIWLANAANANVDWNNSLSGGTPAATATMGNIYNGNPYKGIAQGQWQIYQNYLTTNNFTGSATNSNGIISYDPYAYYYFDDYYFGELTYKANISGANSIAIPDSNSTTSTYTSNVTNQLGTNVGVVQNPPTVTWSVVNSPTGVSINSSTGVLTVDSTAQEGIIKVKATVTPNTGTPGTTSGVSTCYEYKKVTLRKTDLYSKTTFRDGTTARTNIQPGNITAVLSYENFGAGSKDLTFIAALYQDLGSGNAKLINLVPCDKVTATTGASGRVTITSPFTIPQDTNTYFIRTYVWDDINGMVPLKQTTTLN